jgi:molybdopterin/thiamine biosynthesis adenylyltransferase
MNTSTETENIEFKASFTSALEKEMRTLLADPNYAGIVCAFYNRSYGKKSMTFLVCKLIPPVSQDGNVSGDLNLQLRYLNRVSKMAKTEDAGMVILRNVSTTDGADIITSWIDSIPSDETFDPVCELMLDPEIGWVGTAWKVGTSNTKQKLSIIKVVGKSLQVWYDDVQRPKPAFREIYKRTFNVWGDQNHAKLARLRIGIVGLGSVGSIVAETLARIGIERFVLIDFDEIQIHNLDRLLGACEDDINKLKAAVADRQIRKAATAASIETNIVLCGVTEEEGYRNALDCDVIFSCVDRPWPRYVLNHIAYNHLIPVVDGGIGVRIDKESLKFDSADWQLQTVGPERICLQCLHSYESSDVGTEKEGLLDDPSYILGLPDDHEFKRNENIFPFSANLASLEVMQLIEMVTGIGNRDYYGIQRYHYNQGFISLDHDRVCEEGCLFKENVAVGDKVFPPPIGFDHSADAARKRQSGGNN